jgi:hypothetical protein
MPLDISQKYKKKIAVLAWKIKSGKPTFEGVHGFENTVIPELERAIYRDNINLLGLRGQAKQG